MLLNEQPTPVALLTATFTRHWLPRPERTGDRLADLKRALSRPYEIPGTKKPSRIISGLILARPDGAVINVEAPPCEPLPQGVVWRKPSENKVGLGELLLEPPATSFVILLIEKAGCDPRRLAAAGPGTLVVNGADGPRWSARRSVVSALLETGKNPTWARGIHNLLLRRSATDDVAGIDAEIAKRRCDDALLDTIEQATEEEMQVFGMVYRAKTGIGRDQGEGT